MANHKELLKWLKERMDIISSCIREDEDRGIPSPIMHAFYEKDMKTYNALVELVQEDYERQGAEPNLRHCPCCGSDAELVEHSFADNSYTYSVKCLLCRLESNQLYKSKAEAIDAWNRRVWTDGSI